MNTGSNGEIKNLLRMIQNKNMVNYSNVSKISEKLEDGNLSITFNNINSSILMKKNGTVGLVIDLNNNIIRNVNQIIINGSILSGITSDYGESNTLLLSQNFSKIVDDRLKLIEERLGKVEDDIGILSGGIDISTILEGLNDDINELREDFEGHNHDELYSKLDHNHDLLYSDINHNHDLLYSDINHNHDLLYSKLDHNHDLLYSDINHNHDLTYAPISHSHVLTDLPEELLTKIKIQADTELQELLRGPQGIQGIQGPQGIQGIQGEPGIDGIDADEGISVWDVINGAIEVGEIAALAYMQSQIAYLYTACGITTASNAFEVVETTADLIEITESTGSGWLDRLISWMKGTQELANGNALELMDLNTITGDVLENLVPL